MTQDRSNLDPARSLPPVDKVIHDIRESEGHLRSPAAKEPLPGTHAPDGPDEVSSVHHATPVGAAVAGAPPGTGHERSGHAPGHAQVAESAHADTTHGDAHAGEHGEELGPIDTAQWSAGLAGVLVAAVIVACFVMATQDLGAY